MTEPINEKEYIVFMGNFGSGKTELALHFAHASAAAGNATTLVDLDIINPYFRASERRLSLEQEGIRLISPTYAMSDVEIITVPPDVYSAFAPGKGTVIFDVGGDGNGARAMGQYRAYFDKIDPAKIKVWLVINAHRPMSATPEKIIQIMRETEYNSRLSVAGLINNGNMSYETTGEDLAFAYDIVKATSEMTGIPVIMTSGEEKALAEFAQLKQERNFDNKFIGELVAINTRMHRDWDRFVKFGV